MNKTLLSTLALTLVLTSCGGTKEVASDAKKAVTPIQIGETTLGQSNTGFTSDLSNIVEESYQKAATGNTPEKTSTGGIPGMDKSTQEITASGAAVSQ